MSRWKLVTRCPLCEAINHSAPFGAEFENSFSHRKICHSCGNYVNWKDSVERWVSQGKWWNPKTWGKGFWEKKHG